MKKKKKVNLCLGIVCLILILTSWLGGKAVKAYERNNTCCVVPYFSRVLVQARTEDRGLDNRPTPISESQTTEEELVYFYSEKYSVNPQMVSCIIEKESSWNAQAIGDSGLALGLAQFHRGTYIRFRKKMGLSAKDERTDKAEAIKTLVWGLSQGLGSHWTAYGRCR